MSGYLIDSSLISELLQPKPDPNVLRWMTIFSDDSLYLSVLTLGEIKEAALLQTKGIRWSQIETFLASDLRVRFSGRILPVTHEIAQRWGHLRARAKASGSSLPLFQGLLVATAFQHNLTYVTKMAAHPSMPMVHFFNPWEVEYSE